MEIIVAITLAALFITQAIHSLQIDRITRRLQKLEGSAVAGKRTAEAHTKHDDFTYQS